MSIPQIVELFSIKKERYEGTKDIFEKIENLIEKKKPKLDFDTEPKSNKHLLKLTSMQSHPSPKSGVEESYFRDFKHPRSPAKNSPRNISLRKIKSTSKPKK